jgi:catechol 2,3-dioxygenase-like lactoylglutathione lyase family enzyme
VAEFAVPIMPSKNLRETLAFYERLGFENHGAPPEQWDYLIIERGGIELQFYGDPDVDPLSTASMCYVRVDDADAVHAEWDAIGVSRDEATGSRLESPSLTFYGMREFALVDPSGNLLRVGSRPKA